MSTHSVGSATLRGAKGQAPRRPRFADALSALFERIRIAVTVLALARLALVVSIASGSAVATTTPANATLTSCAEANAGGFDRTVTLGTGATSQTGVPANPSAFNPGEILFWTISLTGGDASAFAQLQLIVSSVSTDHFVFGPGPTTVALPGYQGPTIVSSFIYTVHDTEDPRPGAEATFSLQCVDASTLGTIIIRKSTDSDGTFDFTGDLGAFQITTSGGFDSETFSNLIPGTYSVTEAAETGYELTDLVCIDPTSNTTTSAATATIDLAAGETVECTYTNTSAADRTANIIAGFGAHRAGVLTDAGPPMQHYLDRFAGETTPGFEVTPLAYQEIANGGGGAAFDAVISPPAHAGRSGSRENSSAIASVVPVPPSMATLP